MQQDLKGMTLAELRRVNTQLETDRLTENEALRIGYLATQAEYHDRIIAANNDYELKRGELMDKNRLQLDALDDDYKKQGALIGSLMDRRRFCETPEDVDKLRQQIEALEDGYKKFGAHIGTLMDRRKFCESVEEIDKLRLQIDEAMEKRQELRTQRRVLNENFHRALHELKDEHRKARKTRYTEHETKQREFRQARIAIAKKYAALHEEVRKAIGLRKAEERELEATSAEL